MTRGAKLEPPASPRGWPDALLRYVIAVATRNWGTKLIALLLATIVFVVTRDEVQRSFKVPLKVIQDPDRVLLTTTPKTIEVRLRGPWTAINRIGADALGAAVLDLREASPGPMQLDPAAIVMPAGVVLDALDYDAIDLRFEPVVERSVAIRALVVGEVAADYTLVDAELSPERWTLRGPQSRLDAITELTTAPIDVSGALRDLDVRVEVRLPAGTAKRDDPDHPVTFVGVAGEAPQARYSADVEPEQGERSIVVETAAALRAALPGVAETEFPASETVTLRGPLPHIHALEQLPEGVEPLRPVVELERGGEGQAVRAKLAFEWASEVPEATRDSLTISPPLLILQFAVGQAAG